MMLLNEWPLRRFAIASGAGANEACQIVQLGKCARAGARSTLLERLFELARAPGSTDPVDKLDLPCSIDPARCSFEPTTSDLSRF